MGRGIQEFTSQWIDPEKQKAWSWKKFERDTCQIAWELASAFWIEITKWWFSQYNDTIGRIAGANSIALREPRRFYQGLWIKDREISRIVWKWVD
jgi:hypothetical protein